jgi:DnaK suppressor protein
LEKQRRALLALRARLQGNVSRTADRALSEYGIETTCASPDTADRANEILEQDLALSLLGSASGTLEQIEVALQRIEDGSYGRCTECDVTIPVARLEAIPYATCCVQCAAQQEFVP